MKELIGFLIAAALILPPAALCAFGGYHLLPSDPYSGVGAGLLVYSIPAMASDWLKAKF